ncbi:MAG: hypothetical protein COA58_01980 [Bacteroidetes bacterium]|nr:MAG: hypothetical protein COA58_01980 [Bacteroidota bacterium]
MLHRTKKNKPLFLLLILFLFASSASAAPFIGTYVVGAGETYPNLNSIYSDMLSEGLSGHTTIKIKNGTYTQNVSWTSTISGLSETSTITVESNSGNPTDVILQGQSSYSIYINNNSFITLKDLTITQPNSQRCIYLRNSQNIRLINCNIIGTLSTSSTSSYSCIYINGNCSGLEIDNCNVSEGSYGIYYTSQASDIAVMNSSFEDHYYGMYFYYITDLILNNNTMENIQSRGLYINNCVDASITNNNFESNSYHYLYQFSTSKTGKNRIANNIFTGMNSYAVRLDGTNDGLEIYHNTFLSNNSYGLYIRGNSNDVKIKNNLISTNNCNYAMYINNGSFGDDAEIDYNAYSNSNITCSPIYNGNNLSLQEWTNRSGHDANSIHGNANFVSFPSNPKPQNGLFVNLCLPIGEITKDIDGTNRDGTNPDPGALEFNSIRSNDMALMSLNSLQAPNCSGSDDIIVKVKNIGLNPVTAFKLDYTVNGTLVGTYVHSSNLVSYASQEINIGSYSFDGDNDTLELIITEVNSGADADASNNSLPEFRIYDAVSGDYTLGEDDTLKGIQSLFDQMSFGGICGDVHIKINNGTYRGYEDVILKNVKTANPMDRLFIESMSGNREDVTLKTRSNWNRGVLDFENMRNVTIQNLTLDANFNTCNTVININGTAASFELKNLKILGDSTNCSDIIQIDNYVDGILVENCYFYGGDQSFNTYGNGIASNPIIFRNNLFEEFEEGLDVEGHDHVEITNNVFRSSKRYSEGHYFYDNKFLSFTNNILVLDSSDDYMMDLEQTSGTQRSIVANNYFNTRGENSYGIYLYDNPNLDFTNNTILGEVTSNNDATVYLDNMPVRSFVNNIVQNFNENGNVLYINDLPSFTLDNNNYLGGYTVYYNQNGKKYDLVEWQDETGKDLSSMSVDPMFHGEKDFHVCNEALNDAGRGGTYLGKDIDGDSRSKGTTDIGADEFSPASTGDFLVTDFLALCDSNMGTLVASPGATSYSWSNGETTQQIDVTEAGTYTVEVTGLCGSNGTDSAIVSTDSLEAEFAFVFTHGRSIGVYDKSSGAPHTFQWDFGDGNFSSERTPVHIYDNLGFYTITLTVINDCGISTYSKDVSIFNVGIEEIESELSIYPNPTTGDLNIKLDDYSGNFSVTVLSMTGKEVLTFQNINSNLPINITELNSGFYILRIKTPNDVIQTKVYKM